MIIVIDEKTPIEIADLAKTMCSPRGKQNWESVVKLAKLHDTYDYDSASAFILKTMRVREVLIDHLLRNKARKERDQDLNWAKHRLWTEPIDRGIEYQHDFMKTDAELEGKAAALLTLHNIHHWPLNKYKNIHLPNCVLDLVGGWEATGVTSDDFARHLEKMVACILAQPWYFPWAKPPIEEDDYPLPYEDDDHPTDEELLDILDHQTAAEMQMAWKERTPRSWSLK